MGTPFDVAEADVESKGPEERNSLTDEHGQATDDQTVYENTFPGLNNRHQASKAWACALRSQSRSNRFSKLHPDDYPTRILR